MYSFIIGCALISGVLGAPQWYAGFDSPLFLDPEPLDTYPGLLINQPKLELPRPESVNNNYDFNSMWTSVSSHLGGLEDIFSDSYIGSPNLFNQFRDNNQHEAALQVYKITIPLPMFASGDIKIKVQDRSLVLEAKHREINGDTRKYTEVRKLPDDVGIHGVWLFQNGVLEMTFPVIGPVGDKAVYKSPVDSLVLNHIPTNEKNQYEDKTVARKYNPYNKYGDLENYNTDMFNPSQNTKSQVITAGLNVDKFEHKTDKENKEDNNDALDSENATNRNIEPELINVNNVHQTNDLSKTAESNIEFNDVDDTETSSYNTSDTEFIPREYIRK